MSYNFSKSLLNIRPSASMSKGLGSATVKFNLAIGSPDVALPKGLDTIIDKYAQKPAMEYLPTMGTKAARENMLSLVVKANSSEITEDNLVLCSGAKYGIYLSLKTITNPGDNVMLLQPYWLSYPDICSSLYLQFNSVELDLENLSYNIENLKSRLLETKSRVLIINNPNNPCGVVLNEDFLKNISAFCKEHSIWILIDEVYKDLAFPGVKVNHDILGLDGIIRVGSVSKSLAMPGLRLGYVVSNSDFIKNFVLINQHISTCINSFSSFVAENLPLLNLEEFMAQNAALYQQRYTRANEVLTANGYKVIPSKSTFYLFCEIPKAKFKSIKEAEDYFDNAGVRLTTGGHYGSQFQNYLRICLTFDDALWSELEIPFKR